MLTLRPAGRRFGGPLGHFARGLNSGQFGGSARPTRCPPEAQPPRSVTTADELSEAQQEQVYSFIHFLLKENEHMNLTGVTSFDEAMERHVRDSLALLSVIDSHMPATKNLKLVDVGSGAGLPGMLLAIARPTWEVTLLDSLNKRCQFNKCASEACGLFNVDVVWARAEEAGQAPEHRERYDVVTARAVAELRLLAEYCLPLTRVGGMWIAAKGADVTAEINVAHTAIDVLGGQLVDVEPVDSYGPHGQRTAVTVRKVESTPARYPRLPGTPKKNPL